MLNKQGTVFCYSVSMGRLCFTSSCEKNMLYTEVGNGIVNPSMHGSNFNDYLLMTNLV